MKILIATHNREKFGRYQKLLARFSDWQVLSLDEVKINEVAEENFSSNLENAKHKAKFYGDLSGLVTIAIDESVLTSFLPDNQQPGVYVRRFTKNKKELTDDEVVEVWKKIFEKYPQPEKKFIWDFAIAFYNPTIRSLQTCNIEQISYVAPYISDKRSQGYPMSRILSPWKNGKAYSEMTEMEKLQEDEKIFAGFLKKFSKWMEKQ